MRWDCIVDCSMCVVFVFCLALSVFTPFPLLPLHHYHPHRPSQTVIPNETNQRLRQQKQDWTRWTQRADAELAALRENKEKWEGFQVSTTNVATQLAHQGGEQSVGAAELADKTIPDAYKFLSVKGDRLLSLLRDISECVSSAHAHRQGVADAVNKKALGYTVATDSRSLLRAVTQFDTHHN